MRGPRRSCTALYEAAPPAVGPTGTTGRALAAEATHAHLGTAVRGTLWEPRVTSGPEELRDSERTYASMYACLGTAGRGTRKGTVCWAASGPEELRDSERSHVFERDIRPM